MFIPSEKEGDLSMLALRHGEPNYARMSLQEIKYCTTTRKGDSEYPQEDCIAYEIEGGANCSV